MSPALNSAVIGRTDEHTLLSESFPHVNVIYRLYFLSFFLLKWHKSAFCLSFKPLVLFTDDKRCKELLRKTWRWLHCFTLNYSLLNQCFIYTKTIQSYKVKWSCSWRQRHNSLDGSRDKILLYCSELFLNKGFGFPTSTVIGWEFGLPIPWPGTHLHLGFTELAGILCTCSDLSYHHSPRNLFISRLLEFGPAALG